MKSTAVATTANASLQNRINVSIVFNYLREVGVSYRAEIARQLKLSLPAVSRAVKTLMEQGYVVEGDKIKTDGKKTAASVQVNLQKGVVLGVDMLSERVRLALFDLSGRMRASFSGTRLSRSENIVRDLVHDIQSFLRDTLEESAGTASSRMEALTVGVPAVIDLESQRTTNAYLYEGLEGVDLKEELSKHFDVSVYVENIVKLAALGEYKYGQQRRYKDLAFIEIGNGIGAGVILDGEVLRGSSGGAGEIGFTIVGEENISYSGGNKGYLERHASTAGLRESAIAALKEGRSSLMRDWVGGNLDSLEAETIFEAALQGDDLALEIVHSALAKITVAVTNLCNILNPEIVVFGGDIAACPGVEQLLLEPIRESLGRLLPFQPPKVVLSALGQDSALYGASLMAVESLLTGMYPYRIAG